MSDEFVDPMTALATRETLPSVDKRAAVVRDLERALAPIAEQPRAVAHTSTMRVWIDKARAIVLPVITSFTFTQDALDALHTAHEIAITDAASQLDGFNVRKTLGQTRREAIDWYETLRQPFNRTAKAIIGLQDRDVVPITEAEQVLGVKLIAYEKEARRLEEEERQRLQAIADAAARQAQADAAAAMQRVAEAEPDPMVKVALTAEAAGIAAVPVSAAAVSVPSLRARTRGVGFTETHTGELLNKFEFIKAVAAGRIPLDAVEIKQSWIDGKARELQAQLGVVYTFLKYVKHEGTRG